MTLYPHQKEFSYSDGNLYWRISPSNNVKIGSKAGHKESRGYTNVSLRGKKVRLHRLIWEYHNGPIPKERVIDHINRDKSDNRIENLRVVTPSQNGHNRKDVSGIRRHSSAARWQAYITVEGTYYHLGNFKNKKHAIKARKEAQERNSPNQNY